MRSLDRPLLTQTEEHVRLHQGMMAEDLELKQSRKWISEGVSDEDGSGAGEWAEWERLNR